MEKTYKVFRNGKIIDSSIPGRYAGYKKGKIFGRLDCKFGMRMKKENRVFFLTWEDAIAAGYRPCKNCKPARNDIYDNVDGFMLYILQGAESKLPKLLKDRSQWNGLYIDYHPPFVERVWYQWGNFRINLHRIHPCGPEEALFHTHPWPSAMRILSGEYEMIVGYGIDSEQPSVVTRFMLTESSSYEMTHPDGWHYVRPIEKPAISIMITGMPWNKTSPRSCVPLRSLSDRQMKEIFKFFDIYYSRHKSKNR